MTLRLIVMRHAKSDWDSNATTDHARPLNQRGRWGAPLVARDLVRLGWIPQAVRSSDSERTRETFARMQSEFPPNIDLLFTRSLYLAGAKELTKLLEDLDPSIRTVLALGHNPGWQSAVEYFSGESITMTTANAALLSLDSDDWTEGAQSSGCWELVDVLRPE